MPALKFQIKRKCEVCGSIFIAKTLDSKCCSEKCMKVAWKRRKDEEKKQERLKSGYRSFSYRQEGDVKRYMNSQPDKEQAANDVLNASFPILKADECERVKGQLSYIVKDMKEEQQQSRSRGFHF